MTATSAELVCSVKIARIICARADRVVRNAHIFANNAERSARTARMRISAMNAATVKNA